MGNEEFLRLCKVKVAEYTNSHMDKIDGKQITVQYVYVVWSCKTLQNSKAVQRRHGTEGNIICSPKRIGEVHMKGGRI